MVDTKSISFLLRAHMIITTMLDQELEIIQAISIQIQLKTHTKVIIHMSNTIKNLMVFHKESPISKTFIIFLEVEAKATQQSRLTFELSIYFNISSQMIQITPMLDPLFFHSQDTLSYLKDQTQVDSLFYISLDFQPLTSNLN